MADAASGPDISNITEQIADDGVQSKADTLESQEQTLQDTAMTQNAISEEMAGINTTVAPITVSNELLDEHSKTKQNEILFAKRTLHESQDHVVSITTTIAQNMVSDVVLDEGGKTDQAEVVYEKTTSPGLQANQDQDVVDLTTTTMVQNSASNVAPNQSNRADTGEMVFPKATTQEMQENQVCINTTIAQTTVSDVVYSEPSKSDASEMVFTVVAVENSIGDLMQMHPENLPKEVQLSLVQPPPPETNSGNLTSAASSGHLSDINQLAMIAASIEENPKDPGNAPDQTVQMVIPKGRGKHNSPAKSVKGRVLCTICNQDFSDLPSMRRHRLIHSEDKPYQCDFCDKSFRRKDNLREHRNIHTQDSVYKCERCGKTFPRKYTHKVHMSRLCGRVGQMGTESGSWSTTDKSTNAKPNIVASKSSEPCQICSKTFRDASTLKRHLLTHSDERPYKCTECDKAFRRKDHLQEHVIVHKLIRPFSCQTCGKSFSRKNGLKTHMIRTTHLLGFDDITLPVQSKDSADVEVHVVEQELAADQLVASSSDVFPEGSEVSGGVETVCQPTSDKDISESNLPTADSGAVPLAFSELSTNSETVVLSEKTTETTVLLSERTTETTVVLSEKSTETTDLGDPENEALVETSSHDIESDIVKGILCPTCNATFPGKHELWEHFQKHLSENMFACQYCFQIFSSMELIEEHQKSCSVEEDDSALENIGDSQVSEAGSQDSVDQTMGTMIEEGEALGEEVPSETTVNTKKRKRSGTFERTDQTCTICNKVFRDGTALKRHALVHTGERPHSCSHCDKRFRRRDHLKSHEIAHHSGITSHECKTCDAAFNTRYALTVHVKSCKNRPSPPKEPISEEVKLMGSPESKQCPICHKVFKDPSTQRRHFRIHSDERPFPCEICSKSFRRKDNLKEHLLCHSEEKPFSCDHCGKSLSRRSSLTNHMNVCPARKAVDVSSITSAVTENPIIPEMQFTEAAVQDMCVSSDTQEMSAAHLLATGLTSTVVTADMTSLDVTSSDITSSEVAPMEEDIEHGLRGEDMVDDGSGNSFPCEECGKIFRAKWTLKFHQRIHTGEKPHTCTTCGRQFRQASHLKIHERTHSGERPYPCQICGRAFIDSSTLKRHERLHKDAADPNAIIDEQHDIIAAQDDIIDAQNDIIATQNNVIKNQEFVITNQIINDPNEANIVQGACEVSIADEGAIQLLVTTANELANSAQPISTNVVPGMNQSGTRLDESHLGQILRECIRNQAVEKIETLEDWQQSHPNESVEQLIYIETEEPSQTE